MIGLNTTFGTGGATLLLVVAGWVCKTGWVHVCYIYFAVIPVFIIALLCLPMDENPQPIAATESGSKAAIPAKGDSVHPCGLHDDWLCYLRKAISEFEKEKHGLSYEPEEIIVTLGATEAVFSSLYTVLNPGNEVTLMMAVEIAEVGEDNYFCNLY